MGNTMTVRWSSNGDGYDHILFYVCRSSSLYTTCSLNSNCGPLIATASDFGSASLTVSSSSSFSAGTNYICLVRSQ